MAGNGWIKLHRKILNNPICNKPAWAWLWVTLLLLANHEDGDNSFIWNDKKINLEKGQFVTGRKKLSEITGIPESTVERILKYLESEHQIGQQKTKKYRLITILKWEDYQTSDNKTDNKRTTDGQQMDTFKKGKKIRSKEEEGEKTPRELSEDFFSLSEEDFEDFVLKASESTHSPPEFIRSEFKRFKEYWTERTKSGTQQKWELEKTFEIKPRLSKWLTNAQKWNKTPKSTQPNFIL